MGAIYPTILFALPNREGYDYLLKYNNFKKPDSKNQQ